MGLIDITQTLERGMKRYPSVQDFSYEWARHYETGQGMALSRFTMTTHLGTHIDSPFHFIEDGRHVDEIPLEDLCGRAQVVDARGIGSITPAFLEGCSLRAPRLLFLTDNTDLLSANAEFENVYFEADACEMLAEMGTKLVGIDYFTVDKAGDKSHKAHFPLLKAGITILEAIRLRGVQPGEYTLMCLPLKLAALEAAPCRAVLTECGPTETGKEVMSS